MKSVCRSNAKAAVALCLSARHREQTPAPACVSGLRVPAYRRETLGQKVDRLRIDKGMTIEELALDAGVDKKTVLRITSKGKCTTPATLKKLADALGLRRAT